GGLRVDQAGGGTSCALAFTPRKGRVQCPRRALAAHRNPRSLLRAQWQRGVGGRIEVADLAGDREQAALRGEHVILFVDELERYPLQVGQAIPANVRLKRERLARHACSGSSVVLQA